MIAEKQFIVPERFAGCGERLEGCVHLAQCRMNDACLARCAGISELGCEFPCAGLVVFLNA